MKILTLETTCDETAAAVITDKLEVLGAVVASQEKLHQTFGGVVPEIAARAHVERILPVIHQALEKAETKLDELDAVAVANTPGLAGSLLVGLAAAKSLCVALNLPLVAVNHLQAHVYACKLASGEDVFPCIAMVVSGGHTCLFRCTTPLEFELLGATIDDAAGEAFDKVASLLGLPYPGGPAIQKTAESGNAKAFSLPRPMLHDDRLDFSFSGLKTAVRYKVFPPGTEPPSKKPSDDAELEPQVIADLAASFQAAVVDVLVGKCRQALNQTGMSTLCVGGGVAANGPFRASLEAAAAADGFRLYVPPLSLCTDNAVMGAIAIERLNAGLVEDLSLDITPGVVRR